MSEGGRKGGKLTHRLFVFFSLSLSKTHRWHDVLVEGEGDVGAAAVLVRGAGVALDGGLCLDVGVPALSNVQARLHKAMAVPNREAALAQWTPTSTFTTRCARSWAAPHL